MHTHARMHTHTCMQSMHTHTHAHTNMQKNTTATTTHSGHTQSQQKCFCFCSPCTRWILFLVLSLKNMYRSSCPCFKSLFLKFLYLFLCLSPPPPSHPPPPPPLKKMYRSFFFNQGQMVGLRISLKSLSLSVNDQSDNQWTSVSLSLLPFISSC